MYIYYTIFWAERVGHKAYDLREKKINTYFYLSLVLKIRLIRFKYVSSYQGRLQG